MTVTKCSRQAFIAAPPSVDTRVLREELGRRGVFAFELDELAAGGRALAQLMEESVRKADLVVIVLADDKRDNALIELGYALAMKKRVLVIVPPGGDLPLQSIPYLRTTPDNEKAIGTALTQVLAAPEPGHAGKEEVVVGTHPIGKVADDLIHKLRGTGDRTDVVELEEIVQQALTSAGISVMSHSLTRHGTGSARADFAVWSEDFEPWLGNPFLIEVRLFAGAKPDLSEELKEMIAVLGQTRTPWGLLLYWAGGQEIRVKAEEAGPIFVAELGRFLESLRKTSLGEFLRDLRNRRAHQRR